MAPEALVSASLAAPAVPDYTEVVETVVADVAHDDAEVAVGDDNGAVDIADDDAEVVPEAVAETLGNSVVVVGVAAQTDFVASAVQNLPVCKTHPGSAMVATAAD